MRIALASDHGGYELKSAVREHLTRLGHECEDFGTLTGERCDYPDYGAPAARAVASGRCERGILICSTGIGMSICANKVRGVRAALCAEPYSAKMTRHHNDANVLCLGALVTGRDLALATVDAFLENDFDGGRHEARVAKLRDVEEGRL